MENTPAQDLRQSPEYAQYIKKIGWRVEKASGINIFTRKLGPVGISKIQRVNLPLPWEEIKEVLQKNRVLMTKLEPLSTPPPTGFRPDSWPMLATKTIRINLSPGLNKILASFKKDARYCIMRSKRLVTSVQINKFGEFYGMWKEANKIKHLWTPGEKQYKDLVESFGDKCFCVTINNLAGALILMHDKMAYYYHAGSLPEGKKFHLPYLIVWECMKEAKKRGCKIWDFEGIYDPRWPNKSILGYTHFKQSFGGTEVEFPGSFTKWF